MPQILFIEGVSGVGKSTLVSKLTDRLRGQGYSVQSWVEFDFSATRF
jgi:Predicted nucleotide kinase